MTSKTKKPPTSRKLVRQKIGPVDKRRRKRGLTPAIRTAIDAIVFERCSREEGCKRAGITERALYLALEKPEVAAYWNSQIVVLRVGERARNIHVLAEVRDGANQMAKVQAVKTLEQLAEEAPQRWTPGSVTLPGLVIQIVGPGPAPAPRTVGPASTMIDVSPEGRRDE
jgi:hypothetical protein